MKPESRAQSESIDDTNNTDTDNASEGSSEVELTEEEKTVLELLKQESQVDPNDLTAPEVL